MLRSGPRESIVRAREEVMGCVKGGECHLPVGPWRDGEGDNGLVILWATRVDGSCTFALSGGMKRLMACTTNVMADKRRMIWVMMSA